MILHANVMYFCISFQHPDAASKDRDVAGDRRGRLCLWIHYPVRRRRSQKVDAPCNCRFTHDDHAHIDNNDATLEYIETVYVVDFETRFDHG